MKFPLQNVCALLLLSAAAKAVDVAPLITAPSSDVPSADVSSALRYRTTWLGNSFGGGDKWVQNFAEDFQVMPDGTCIVGSFWDEAGRDVGFYKDGQVVGKLEETHMRGGKAICATAKYVFYAHTSMREDQPQVGAGEARSDKPICYFGVSRWTRDGKIAPFEGGQTRFKNMVAFRQAPDEHNLIARGLATNGRELFVADTMFNRIRVLDTETMKPLRDFAANAPEKIALDARGDLWVTSTGGKTIARFSAKGRKLANKIVFPSGTVAAGLAFAPDGRLIVCDNGPRQQVLFFGVKSGKMVGTFGERGGMFGAKNPGRVAPLRLPGPIGAAFDARGNFYVACNVPRGETVLRAFSPETKGNKPRKLKWELLGLEFVDVADAVPGSDGRDVYSADDRYVFDPQAPAGKGWTWRAHTLDPFRYPDDLRLHQSGLQCGTSIRRLGGETFLCQRGMWQGILGFYRIEGELAVMSTVLSSDPIKAEKEDKTVWRPDGQPEKGRFFWRDLNGNGRFEKGEYTPTTGPEGEFWASNVDARGDIWQGGQESGIWKWKFTGLDAHKNPTYDAKPQHWPMPAPFSNLLRTEYIPETDTMYLTGQTPDHAMTGGEWGSAGSVLVRFDNWSTTPKMVYRVNLPYEAGKIFMVSFHVAGDLCFFVDCRQANVYVYDKRDGRFLGKMKPGPEVAGESGWVDFRDGLRATRLKNGNYLVFVEEDWKGKSIAYLLQNPLQ